MKEKRKPNNPLTIQPQDLQIPYHFRCPISLELIHDPVTISTGQTYDRTSIQSWISTGQTTCPVTNSHLSDFTLTPNHTLRRLIQQWCVAHHSLGVQRIPTPKQPVEVSLVRNLLADGNLRRICSLANESEFNKTVISSLNVRDVAISILFKRERGKPDFVSDCVELLAIFPPYDPDCLAIGSDRDRVGFLVSLLFDEISFDVRVNSAALIESIISGVKSSDIRSEISNSDEIFVGVVSILSDVNLNQRALKIGVKTLFALCLNKNNRHRAVTAGAVHALMMRLNELDKCDCERALATVELLCRVPQGCSAFGAHALTVPLLVKTILKVSDRATEYSAGALLSLCSTSEKLQSEAVNAGVLTQLLLLVQSDCTPRAKRKAQMMLKLLRDSWPCDSVANSDDFNCSDVVPF